MQFDQTLNTIEIGKSKLVVSNFGGQLISWTHNAKNIIFENSENAIKDLSTAYRGGAPICFPYFAKGTLLSSDSSIKNEVTPQHGAARTSIWKKIDSSSSSITVQTLQTTPITPDSKNQCSADLQLTIQYSLSEPDSKSSKIQITASVENLSQNSSLYQLAFHTYWTYNEPSKIKIQGLGREYLDNLAGLKKCSEDNFVSVYPAALDRVYISPLDKVCFTTDEYQVQITNSGLNQAVVWNPGSNHSLKDIKTPSFFCVESGAITPAPTIAPLERQTYTMTYLYQLT
jgi:glucose-6-phosphate 1-epimerase